MYPVIRLIGSAVRAHFAPETGIDEASEMSFICRPWDIDMFFEMNNGRILTLYDLGRFDLAIRGGLMSVLRKKKWGLVVAGASVRYRRRVRMFDKVTMRSKLAGFDERWVYILQSMWVRGQPTSSILLRTAVTRKGSTVPVSEILAEFNRPDWRMEPDGWIKDWIASEVVREWPPGRS
ncbi:MAG: acyl-CoA thioesterase [Thiolinea sp.]